jgi:protein-L-isoaspartate(D-aspartate) O-methyltransferase
MIRFSAPSQTRAKREYMVASQLARRGVTDERVLEAMREVPRDAFVQAGMEEFAYEDSPLPIGAGQTISQPYIVALMIQAAAIKPGDYVLDVGTGSGYAAAVLSRLAGKVYSVERHRDLADSARRTLAKLRHTNVEVRHGDGTLGWPDAAPFDAILVAAGGPEIPEALRRQLKIGGRLIIPIGELGGVQELVKVVRDGDERFHEEDLGPVTFVPLIGAAGWSGPGLDATAAFERLWPKRPAASAPAPSATELIRAAAEPLPETEDPGFGAMFDRFAKARIVLLGEATHGTSEFYRARAQITRLLIERHGFNIVAVEADWPDAARIDRYVRHKACTSAAGLRSAAFHSGCGAT